MSTMFKMIGITYIAEFSSGICKDAGYQTLAGQIEIFGKLTILVLGLPVLLALLQTIRGVYVMSGRRGRFLFTILLVLIRIQPGNENRKCRRRSGNGHSAGRNTGRAPCGI